MNEQDMLIHLIQQSMRRLINKLFTYDPPNRSYIFTGHSRISEEELNTLIKDSM